MSLPVYRMSGVGCQRALVAQRLGYEPSTPQDASTTILEEGTWHEELVKRRLTMAGIEFEEGGVCEKCKEEFGDERYGIHVELVTDLVRFVGHLDGGIPWDGIRYPLEVKSLGKFTWDKFQKEQFSAFPEYAAQEALYLEALHIGGGVYIVKKRDNGELLIYEVGRLPGKLVEKLNTISAIYGHVQRIDIPPVDPVLNKIHYIELCAQANELPEGEYPAGYYACRWCGYKYLCIRSDEVKADAVNAKVVTNPELVQAAEDWKEGYELTTQGEYLQDRAKRTLAEHAKSSGESKYKVSGLSVTYSGQKTKKYLDEKILEALVKKEILDKARKESAPWDAVTIRRIDR